MRHIVFDTETTGLSPRSGHRIVEIGCVELINRRPTRNNFHCYLNPERESDPKALAVHGLEARFLADKPLFPEVSERFLDYVRGATLVAHNASFDVAFIDAELTRCSPYPGSLREHAAGIIDTLDISRERFPGRTLSLDQLCARLGIDASHRTLHGALLDAQLLARAWLALTTRQDQLALDPVQALPPDPPDMRLPARRGGLPVVRANAHETAQHEQMLARIVQQSGRCLWPVQAPPERAGPDPHGNPDAKPPE